MLGLAACEPSTDRGTAAPASEPKASARPAALDGGETDPREDGWELRFSDQPPRLAPGGAQSRYGAVHVSEPGAPRSELRFKGETLMRTRSDGRRERLEIREAVKLGDQDLFLIAAAGQISATGKTEQRRFHVLAISPGPVARLSESFGPAVSLEVTAVNDRGYTIQVPTTLRGGFPAGYTCFDYNAGQVTQRSCPKPLTRADDRRLRPPQTIALASCRSPYPRVVRREGLDTARASITAQHTLSTALNWCMFMADYERGDESARGEDLASCAESILARKQTWTARADCPRGVVTEVDGGVYRYGGQGNSSMGGVADLWFDVKTGKELAPACATNYDAVLSQFTALCPKASGGFLRRP